MKKRRLDVLDADGKIIASAIFWCENGEDFCKVMNYAYWPKSITANLVDCEETASTASMTTTEIKEEREACAKIADVKVEKLWPETAVEAAKEIAARIRRRGQL